MTVQRPAPRVGVAGTRFALTASLLVATLTATTWGEGSELPDGSICIKALPFTDTGNTFDNDDNQNVEGFECPYAGSQAPDVFYCITPLMDMHISITLCNSDYDTKLYVLDQNLLPIACNDDKCVDGNGDPTLRSELECVPLQKGMTYHIGVDGFGMFSGPYEITVTACTPPPPWECPKGASQEGEPCMEGSPDVVNPGCNREPPDERFSPIACDETICGTTWWQGGGGVRDTDWYKIETTVDTTFTLEAQFNFTEGIIGFVAMNFGHEGSGDCDQQLGLSPSQRAEVDEIVSITTETLPPGIHWFFVSVPFGDAVPCDGDNDYWIRLTCVEGNPCNPDCLGDTNGDSVVDFEDIIQILSDWGPCPK